MLGTQQNGVPSPTSSSPDNQITPKLSVVRSGLDRIANDPPRSLDGARVGLVTNASAVTGDLRDCVPVLVEAGLPVVALFAPEHGLAASAAAGEKVTHSVEPRTGLPVYSLYGDRRAPEDEMLAPLTHLVVDLPDIGARFYTYVSTLVAVLKGAAHHGIPVIVLDRPNPLTGHHVEGPILEQAYHSFVGALPVPVRHGMTMGELALLANETLEIGASLEIIQVTGWDRRCWFDESERCWVPPSPNIPRAETALIYCGTCLVEGTSLSEGRGTPLPFEVVGAPWLDGPSLADRLNELALPGVRFRATHFVPSASKHAGELCQGVQVHILDRERVRPVRLGLHLLAAAHAQAPDQFRFREPSAASGIPPFDLLIGNPHVRDALSRGAPVEEIAAAWLTDEKRFKVDRSPFLLY